MGVSKLIIVYLCCFHMICKQPKKNFLSFQKGNVTFLQFHVRYHGLAHQVFSVVFSSVGLEANY